MKATRRSVSALKTSTSVERRGGDENGSDSKSFGWTPCSGGIGFFGGCFDCGAESKSRWVVLEGRQVARASQMESLPSQVTPLRPSSEQRMEPLPSQVALAPVEEAAAHEAYFAAVS